LVTSKKSAELLQGLIQKITFVFTFPDFRSCCILSSQAGVAQW